VIQWVVNRAPFLASIACLCAWAQGADLPAGGETIVVTATRTERDVGDVPASVDTIGAARIREGQLQVNLSETLPALAGVVANNRQNYAQDLQVSIRGFGARSSFGVRGLRVIVDGIPATLPDGQAQVSHVDLGSAARIEVLRGPFSVLYGNAAGGVIDISSQAPAPRPQLEASLAAGSFDTWRAGAVASGRAGALGYTVSAGRFETDGYREHSAAVRSNGNAVLRWQAGPRTSVVAAGNVLDMPDTQDPLGLTRAQYESDPRSVAAPALLFDTRKSVDQAQAGIAIEHALEAAGALRLALHGGERGTQQFQSIPVAVQASPLHPGGVIDLARRYAGVDLRWTRGATLGGGAFGLVVGASADGLDEDRRGYQNFSGGELGVQGELRRDERNRVTETGVYAQAEWDPLPDWRFLAGVRASRVAFRSDDRYVTAANPDDSGRVSYTATTPVAGVTWRAGAGLNLYAAAGRGFETPTTNELAYRPDGASGLNLDLAPAKSDHLEGGIKWSAQGGWRARAALFRVETEDEIVVATNAGGRATFRNAGGTRRQGVELQAERAWGPVALLASFTSLTARYRDVFAGNDMPGIPRRSAFADLTWRPAAGALLGLEVRHGGRMFVNDANADASPAYTVASLRASADWRLGATPVQAFLRIDNAFDRRYAGSVIVNEANARYFEPAPGRTWLAGLRVVLGD
jgi:iron complex outermembrane receptor protein